MPKEEIEKLGEAMLKALNDANELTLEDAEINAEERVIDLVPFIGAAVGRLFKFLLWVLEPRRF